MIKKIVFLFIAMCFVIAGCSSDNGGGSENQYPNKNISAISPWPAGSGSDIALRGYTDYLSKELNQSINVQNITGGNGGVGWAEAAKAKSDGYNMSLLTFDILTNEALGVSDVSYKDFEIINMFTVQGMLLITHPDYGISSIEEFLELANKRKNDGETISIGTNGDYGIWHQAGALMEKVTETVGAYKFVPMDGSSEQVTELLGKHIDAIIVSPTPAIGHIMDGKLTGLASFTNERISSLPDIPTFIENGYDVTYESWRAIAVPKGTDAGILKILREKGKLAFEEEEFKKWAEETNIDPYYMDAEESLNYIEELYPKVEEIIRDFDLN